MQVKNGQQWLNCRKRSKGQRCTTNNGEGWKTFNSGFDKKTANANSASQKMVNNDKGDEVANSNTG